MAWTHLITAGTYDQGWGVRGEGGRGGGDNNCDRVKQTTGIMGKTPVALDLAADGQTPRVRHRQTWWAPQPHSPHPPDSNLRLGLGKFLSLSVRKCKFYFFVLNGLSEVCFCGGIYRGLDLYVEKYDKVPEGSILLAVLYQSNKSGIFTSSESAFSL